MQQQLTSQTSESPAKAAPDKGISRAEHRGCKSTLSSNSTTNSSISLMENSTFQAKQYVQRMKELDILQKALKKHCLGILNG